MHSPEADGLGVGGTDVVDEGVVVEADVVVDEEVVVDVVVVVVDGEHSQTGQIEYG